MSVVPYTMPQGFLYHSAVVKGSGDLAWVPELDCCCAPDPAKREERLKLEKSISFPIPFSILDPVSDLVAPPVTGPLRVLRDKAKPAPADDLDALKLVTMQNHGRCTSPYGNAHVAWQGACSNHIDSSR